ncbi:MAG: hypothetical protein R6U04_11585 [Bacteroidales bacterium]
MRLVYLIILGTFITISCTKENGGNQHIQHIDSLLTEIDTLNSKLKKIDIEPVIQLNDSVEQEIENTSSIQKTKKLQTIQNHTHTIIQWYDDVYQEVILNKNFLEKTKKEAVSGKINDSTMLNKIEKEDTIFSNMKPRIEEQIIKLDQEINNIKQQYLNKKSDQN